MPRTALKNVSSNLPATPGRQVKYLSDELGKRETENQELKSNISDLTKALDNLQLVKDKVESDNNVFIKADAAGKKSKKKLEGAPTPATSAYSYFREANKDKYPDDKDKPETEKTNWRELWKECQGDERKKYVDLAAEDKKRFEVENEPYQQKVKEQEVEKKALGMYYEKQKQELAMEFYEAHLQAQSALDEKNNKTKKTKDPDAPKRPISNYMYFVQEGRAAVVEANPSVSVTEVSKILGEEWSKKSKGKGGKKGTKKYDDLAAKDRVRYEKEKAVYDANKAEQESSLAQQKQDQLQQDKIEAIKLMNERREEQQREFAATVTATDETNTEVTKPLAAPQDKKKKERKPGPKKVCSAYIFFTVQNRDRVKTTMSATASNQELMVEIGRQWKALGDEEKKPYEELSAKDKVRYDKEAQLMKDVGGATKSDRVYL